MSGSAAVVFVKKNGYNENLCHWGGLDCLQLSGIDPNLMNIAFSLFRIFIRLPAVNISFSAYFFTHPRYISISTSFINRTLIQCYNWRRGLVRDIPLYQVFSFLTLLKTPLTPPSFWTFGRFFWRTGRSEGTVSNIPYNLNNSTIKKSFGVNFKYFYANLM